MLSCYKIRIYKKAEKMGYYFRLFLDFIPFNLIKQPYFTTVIPKSMVFSYFYPIIKRRKNG